MKKLLLALMLLSGLGTIAQNRNYAPYKALSFELKQPLGQLRTAPVNLGEGRKGLVVIFSADKNIDPFEGVFVFPKDPPKIAVIDDQGKELWRKELPNTVAGIWFLPVLPFDMNKDGVDEIYYVEQTSEKPFKYEGFFLRANDPNTGRQLGEWPWLMPAHNQANSYKWRFFLVGGHVKGEPVLTTIQGLYTDIQMKAFDADMKLRWEKFLPNDGQGPRGSHSTPILDLNKDGDNEFLFGERCIAFDDGRELFAMDAANNWNEHSDMVLPIWNRKSEQWNFFTTREKGDDFERFPNRPRAVMFDQRGEHLWDIGLYRGHFHYGWVGNVGTKGERYCYAGRYSTREENSNRQVPVGKTYDALTGKVVSCPLPHSGRIVDFNGDGFHEMFAEGKLYDNEKRLIVDLQSPNTAIAKKLFNLPGEQLLIFFGNGRVELWADRNAKENALHKTRFASPFYQENVRHNSVGYNANFPILNF